MSERKIRIDVQYEGMEYKVSAAPSMKFLSVKEQISQVLHFQLNQFTIYANSLSVERFSDKKISECFFIFMAATLEVKKVEVQEKKSRIPDTYLDAMMKDRLQSPQIFSSPLTSSYANSTNFRATQQLNELKAQRLSIISDPVKREEEERQINLKNTQIIPTLNDLVKDSTEYIAKREDYVKKTDAVGFEDESSIKITFRKNANFEDTNVDEYFRLVCEQYEIPSEAILATNFQPGSVLATICCVTGLVCAGALLGFSVYDFFYKKKHPGEDSGLSDMFGKFADLASGVIDVAPIPDLLKPALTVLVKAPVWLPAIYKGVTTFVDKRRKLKEAASKEHEAGVIDSIYFYVQELVEKSSIHFKLNEIFPVCDAKTQEKFQNTLRGNDSTEFVFALSLLSNNKDEFGQGVLLTSSILGYLFESFHVYTLDELQDKIRSNGCVVKIGIYLLNKGKCEEFNDLDSSKIDFSKVNYKPLPKNIDSRHVVFDRQSFANSESSQKISSLPDYFYFDKLIVKETSRVIQLATLTFELPTKILIWRDPNYRNEFNWQTFQDIKYTFGANLLLYGVTDKEGAFQAIDDAKDKNSIYLVSNLGENQNGSYFLQECRKRGAPNNSLIFCSHPESFFPVDFIEITVRVQRLFEFINDTVLGWHEDEYADFLPPSLRPSNAYRYAVEPVVPILIWRDSSFRSDLKSYSKNYTRFQKLRLQYGAYATFYDVSLDVEAFSIIDQTTRKDSIFIISNFGDGGVRFVQDCQDRNVSSQCVVFCRHEVVDIHFFDFPQIKFTKHAPFLRSFLEQFVLKGTAFQPV